MSTKGIYIYGIIPNFYNADMLGSFENLDVYTIPYQKISAIVSDREKVIFDNPDREALGHLLVDHQRTIEELMVKGFNMLIPMQLGTIVNSRNDVYNILANGHDLMVDSLNKILNLTEIDLVVTWDDFIGSIPEIAADPEITAMKEEIMAKSDAISQLDQVKIGMLMEEKIKERNTRIELDILEALSASTIDIKMHEVMNVQMIINSAFLVSRSKREKFEQVIDKLDEKYNGMLKFKLVGPLPCYSFYTLEVKELDKNQVLLAREKLGVDEISSDAEIKRAFQEKAKEYHPDVNQSVGNEDHFNQIKKAYRTLIEYSEVLRRSLNEQMMVQTKENEIGNLILVKIKE